MSTQNILKEEAYLTDVIDPLGGSYYVEKLTDQMEEKILGVIARIDEAGGMYAAVEAGLAQRICGESRGSRSANLRAPSSPTCIRITRQVIRISFSHRGRWKERCRSRSTDRQGSRR